VPVTFLDFMMRRFEVSCRAKIIEGGGRRLTFKMVPQEDEDREGEEEEEEEEEAGGLPKLVMNGFFENMALVVVYNPEETNERGNMRVSMMKSYYTREGQPPVDLMSEASLKETSSEEEQTPLMAHFTADNLLTEVPLMAMVPEVSGAGARRERRERTSVRPRRQNPVHAASYRPARPLRFWEACANSPAAGGGRGVSPRRPDDCPLTPRAYSQ
jgi:hypothetical protein